MSEREGGIFLYPVALDLVQGVSLERLMNSSRFFAAPTWRAQAIGLAERGQLSSLLHPIGAATDAFASSATWNDI
jgi:hypothetical protein